MRRMKGVLQSREEAKMPTIQIIKIIRCRLQIFHVQSSEAVATICFLIWRDMPPIALLWAAILELFDILPGRGS